MQPALSVLLRFGVTPQCATTKFRETRKPTSFLRSAPVLAFVFECKRSISIGGKVDTVHCARINVHPSKLTKPTPRRRPLLAICSAAERRFGPPSYVRARNHSDRYAARAYGLVMSKARFVYARTTFRRK